MNSSDTIVAISSSIGAAARMIVRISGADAHQIARSLIVASTHPHRSEGSDTEIPGQTPAGAPGEIPAGSAFLCRIRPGLTAWLYWFAAPRSYTGEDLVEFHIPGSPILARMLLDEIVRHGARQAEAGEFTARAYFNGRIDLTQAEGVAATIAAHSERELRAARQLLGGELARRLGPVMESVAEALALVEVGIDFSDEDVTFLSADQVRDRCAAAMALLEVILKESARFERLSHEPKIVLIGRPNAGKSTLLNALAGSQRAVVSDIAGTTRDAISAEVKLARGMVRLVDVAGLEEAIDGQHPAGSIEGEIARQMHEQALRAVAGADLVVWVEDCCSPDKPIELGRDVDLVVFTKVDLLEEGQKTKETDKNVRPTAEGETVDISAKTGRGLEQLRERLDQLAFGAQGGIGLALNARHVGALGEARNALSRARGSVEAGAEVVAMELREALDALGGVLGKMSPDDLLGLVFGRFCIGK